MRQLHRRLFLSGLSAAVAAPALAPSTATAAPSAKLISGPWRKFGSDAGPDHAPWSEFLARHRRVNKAGVALLDYKAAKRRSLKALNGYLKTLQATDPSTLSKDAAFAFWANLYNAQTVALVLEAYPVRSIKKVRGGLFGSGPWGEKVMRVAGRELSLDNVEHGILRPVWGDPRVHYAVNCASIGCPNLPDKAWRADTLDADLTQAAISYVNNPRGARVERGRLIVSSIYEWFQDDFGGNDKGVIRHLNIYAGRRLRGQLKGIDRVHDDEYDWSLNDV